MSHNIIFQASCRWGPVFRFLLVIFDVFCQKPKIFGKCPVKLGNQKCFEMCMLSKYFKKIVCVSSELTHRDKIAFEKNRTKVKFFGIFWLAENSGNFMESIFFSQNDNIYLNSPLDLVSSNSRSLSLFWSDLSLILYFSWSVKIALRCSTIVASICLSRAKILKILLFEPHTLYWIFYEGFFSKYMIVFVKPWFLVLNLKLNFSTKNCFMSENFHV